MMLNKHERQVIKLELDKEQRALDDLERQYKRALRDIEQKIRLLQNDDLTQSKVYQLQYQKALRGQVSGILDKLQGDEYATIQDYLHGSYQDGFIGTMYSIHGQGIPLIVPLDQNAAVKAILTDSKISEGLYNHLGVNIKQLKQAISSEITRGIASNMPFADIARNISNRSKASLGRAKTIVRTEAHRISEAAAADARNAAKERGCDVVKQWDSTLDSGTRPTHRRLDGQIRETDEPFEMDGKTAMQPGDFGRPEEDCNCRCVSLTRAKWALDEEELEILKERAKKFGLMEEDSKAYGHAKAKDFAEFKKKYLQASETLKNQGKSGTMNTGAKGALTSENDPDYKKRNAHAKRYYTGVRNSKKEYIVDRIAANTGIDRDVVDKMMTHLFYTKHELDKGFDYFDYDYDISESVRRLRSNDNIRQHDLILIQHEAYESELMAAGMTFDEAHETAQRKYNYKTALDAFLKENGLE